MGSRLIEAIPVTLPLDNASGKRSQARLAILADFPEEGWPSMDLVADMLLLHGEAPGLCEPLHTCRFCPPFRRRATRFPWLGRSGFAFNMDRVLNRFWDYPRRLRREKGEFELFHIADHSYAQIVHELPPERTGVFCHDLDAFRCLLEPAREPRPFWFTALTRRILRGLQKAAVVFHSTAEVRRQITHYGLVEPGRLVAAPYGIAQEFTPEPSAEERLPAEIDQLRSRPYLLHVGSTIPRKRIDVLLQVFAAARRHYPNLALVKVGGPWTAAQQDLLSGLGITDAVTQLIGLERRQVAGLYRKAALVLLPSEAEGFGLPVIEALACGAVVIASDIPTLREVGGEAAVFCPVSDVGAWTDTVCRLLADPAAAPDRSTRLRWAARFSWANHARVIFGAYARLLEEGQ